MRYLFTLALAAFAAITFAQNGSVLSLTLEEALAQAKANNKTLANAALDVDYANTQVNEIKGELKITKVNQGQLSDSLLLYSPDKKVKYLKTSTLLANANVDLSNYVTLDTYQNINAEKEFTENIVVNGVDVGGGRGIGTVILGEGSGQNNSTGTNWTAIGYRSGFSNVNKWNWTAIGFRAGYDNISGTDWTAIGFHAGGYNVSSTDWIALGSEAALKKVNNQAATEFYNSTYIGTNTRVSSNGVTNENVFGYSANGKGSNTVAIGNSSITDNYFNGKIHTNNLKIEDVLEDNTATKLAVIDDAGNVGYVDKSSVTPTVINANTIADGSVSNDEFQRLNGLTQDINVSLSQKEETINKSPNFTSPNNISYPTTKAVDDRFNALNEPTIARKNINNNFSSVQTIGASGGTNGTNLIKSSYAHIATQRSTGALIIGYATNVNEDEAGFKSATSVNIKRSALVVNEDKLVFMTAPEQATTIGDDITNQTQNEVYHSGNLPASRTIDTSTAQTSTLLNNQFPLENNPIGTTVTNLNALQAFMYVRISNLLWRILTLGSTI